MSTNDALPDLDPLLDLDADAPPEFKCPITMSIMREPVIMPDGQTYEKSAIANALKANPISPLTRQPMSMKDAKVNYALKSLIDKYIQDHKHELKDTPDIIDPTKMVEATPAEEQVSIAQLHELQIETFSGLYDQQSMLLTIKPLLVPGRLPVSIIALIDISGSMEANASLPTEGQENTFFSRMQLVQYSLKTIISILGPSDRITLITFSTTAKVLMESVELDKFGKKTTIHTVDKFAETGKTNIWDALDKGIDHAIKEKNLIEGYKNKKKNNGQINTSILLFTDGEPNINPPIGIIPTLKEKISTFDKTHFSISTFGFGYQIDSELLLEIAEIGNGIYGYCPDVTMVGTIFINYLSSFISMVAPIAVLKVDQKEYKIALYNDAPTNLMIDLADFNKNPADLQINLTLPLTNQVILIKDIKKVGDDPNELILFRDQFYRKKLIDLIIDSKNNKYDREESRKNAIALYEKLRNEKDRTQFLNNLMIDLYNDDDKHGQIERAYRQEYYQKWGKNYLFSLLRFHILEQCGNFKDLSLQLYGNDVFKKVRKIGNKIFMNLPIPSQKQSKSTPRFSRNITNFNQTIRNNIPNTNQMSSTRRMTMRSFHSSSIVICFNGDALIDLWGGSKKMVKNIQKGDKLSNGAKVVCLIRCATENGFSDAVKIGDALFSPYHPVKVNVDGQKSWVFPVDVDEPQKVEIDYWYNMIIDHENSPVVIGGVETVTLGHNMKNDVCYHPYYGTKKVVNALKKYDQFKNGFIEFKDPPVAKRDPLTNMVIECF